MCDNNYCDICDAHAHAHGVEDWARGLRHTLPEFGDLNQREVARMRRDRLFEHLTRTDPARAMEFPEFKKRCRPEVYVDRFAHHSRASFDMLVRELSGFAQHVSSNPFECKKKGRKARLRALKMWKVEQIKTYFNQGHDRIHELVTVVNLKLPWWLTYQLSLPATLKNEEQEVRLPLAA